MKKASVRWIGIVVAITVLGSVLAYQTGVSSAQVSSSTVATLNQWAGLRNCTYQIFTDGTTYYAQNCDTGAISYSGTAASTVIQNVINTLSSGDKVVFKRGTYTLTSNIALSADNRVELDGGGATITGAKFDIGGSETGNAKHTYIHDFKFSGASAGVIVDNTFGVNIENT